MIYDCSCPIVDVNSSAERGTVSHENTFHTTFPFKNESAFKFLYDLCLFDRINF